MKFYTRARSEQTYTFSGREIGWVLGVCRACNLFQDSRIEIRSRFTVVGDRKRERIHRGIMNIELVLLVDRT